MREIEQTLLLRCGCIVFVREEEALGRAAIGCSLGDALPMILRECLICGPTEIIAIAQTGGGGGIFPEGYLPRREP